ncbi:MAG: phosphate ABC transporter permease subunit PstC, partial [Syntrophomonas sp.]|nr:phosphate ABC transporter permease subunit PstC [Syntrophomonas sp.]
MNQAKNSGLSHRGEKLIENALMFCAALFIIVIALITLFIFARGLPILLKVGIGDFLFSSDWRPTKGMFGIWPMFVGSLAVTSASMLWAVPLGIITAIFMAEIAPFRVGRMLGNLVDLLAGIPSVVYGFVGLIVIVPFIRDLLGGNGLSVLAGGIILGIMILP